VARIRAGGAERLCASRAMAHVTRGAPAPARACCVEVSLAALAAEVMDAPSKPGIHDLAPAALAAPDVVRLIAPKPLAAAVANDHNRGRPRAAGTDTDAPDSLIGGDLALASFAPLEYEELPHG